jgi:hypothetical protein
MIYFTAATVDSLQMAHAGASDGWSGPLQFLRQNFAVESRAEVMARGLLTDIIINYPCDFTDILINSLIAEVDKYMDRVRNGEFFTEWTFKEFVIDVHDSVVIAAFIHPDIIVRTPTVPSKYITLLALVIPEFVDGTEYDFENFNEDDMSTVDGGDSDASEEF